MSRVGAYYSPKRVARGMARRNDSDLRRIVISMDTETFEEVAAGAQANRCTFAAQARMLIEVGLETLKLEGDA